MDRQDLQDFLYLLGTVLPAPIVIPAAPTVIPA